MKPAKIMPQPNDRARTIDPQPDRTKCREQKSKELNGHAPGDRGMCQKESQIEGSE